MGEIKIDGYICERCAHRWISRVNSSHKPFVCPKCKSPYWNVPRKAHFIGHRKIKGGEKQ